MCLSTVDTNIKFQEDKVIVAWKGFVIWPGNKNYVYSPLQGTKILRGEWVTCDGKWISMDWRGIYKGAYRAGFHACKSRESARSWGSAVRVLLKDVHTVGSQNGYIVYVASEIYVPKHGEDIKVNRSTGRYSIVKTNRKRKK